jgi:hypothetical protein
MSPGRERSTMLLRRRAAGISPGPANPSPGYEHLQADWFAILRWLQANRVEYVLVGPAGEAVRGVADAHGPASIVPAPYGRNLDRLARGLWAARARLRLDVVAAGGSDTLPVKMTAEKLGRGQRWTFRCETYDVDVEGHAPGAPSYQELLYEAARFQIAPDLGVEVAAPDDLERYSYMRRTGIAPEIKITRNTQVEQP